MARFVALAIALWPAIVVAENPPALRSPADLARLCGVGAPQSERQRCRAYLEGVYDTVNLFATFGLIEREICPPAEIDAATLHDILLAKMHLDAKELALGGVADPDTVDYTRRVASAQAIVAWARALPCR